MSENHTDEIKGPEVLVQGKVQKASIAGADRAWEISRKRALVLVTFH